MPSNETHHETIVIAFVDGVVICNIVLIAVPVVTLTGAAALPAAPFTTEKMSAIYATTTLMIPDAFHAIVNVAPAGAVTVPPNRTYEINGFTPAPGVESYTTADVAEIPAPDAVHTAFAIVHDVVCADVIAFDPGVTPPAVYPFAVPSSVHAVENGAASKYLCVAT